MGYIETRNAPIIVKVTRVLNRAALDTEPARASDVDAKRGIAITPVKFGISFTATFFNQAGALVLVYGDGSVQLNHGVSYRVDIGDMDLAFRQRK